MDPLIGFTWYSHPWERETESRSKTVTLIIGTLLPILLSSPTFDLLPYFSTSFILRLVFLPFLTLSASLVQSFYLIYITTLGFPPLFRFQRFGSSYPNRKDPFFPDPSSRETVFVTSPTRRVSRPETQPKHTDFW